MRANRWRLVAILGISMVLRVWLAVRGGEWFWPDEARYGSAQTAAHELLRGHWRGAAVELFKADHTLFRWFGLPPALFEQVAGPHPALAACYFGLFSVLAIALIWAIARRAGAGEREALWAAYLAACANTLFYYSRHYFPYDISLCAMLAGLWLGMGPWSWRNSLICGVIVGIGFLTYNGYWLLGGCVLVLHVVLGQGGWRLLPARAGCSAAGLILPLGVILALALALGIPLPSLLLQFAGTVLQGDFYLGHRVMVEYLWYAEGGLLVLWLAGFGFALMAGRGDRPMGRLSWYTGGVVMVAAGLIFFSDVVPKFMIYGRLVRTLVPFLCLGAAAGIERFLETRGTLQPRWSTALALLVATFAVFNFATPLFQWFPVEFQAAAAGKAAVLERLEPGNYRTVNASFFFSPQAVSEAALPAATLWRVPHPQQFLPYQYEGSTREERALFRARDISMRLVRLTSEGNHGWLGASPELSRFDGYPGAVAIHLMFRNDAFGRHEPLVVTGESGKGDFAYIIYQDESQICLGFDHWGVGGVVSLPLTVDFSRPHDIVISMGSLYPPDYSSYERHRLYVSIDGRVIFDRPQDFHPSDAKAVIFGLNLIGGGSTFGRFSGTIERVTPVVPPKGSRQP
jgi:hypothetical protein